MARDEVLSLNDIAGYLLMTADLQSRHRSNATGLLQGFIGVGDFVVIGTSQFYECAIM
jgi:hypothetical protein